MVFWSALVRREARENWAVTARMAAITNMVNRATTISVAPSVEREPRILTSVRALTS